MCAVSRSAWLRGEVWIDPEPVVRDEGKHWRSRMEDGLEHNIRLVIAKSVLGLQASGADYREPLGIGARFGTTYSANGWGAAMSILTCTANILPQLHEDDRPRALYQGLRHVARECAGKAPRFAVEPLPTGETRPEVFARWFRNFIDVRDDEGAERCLVTAIELGISRQDIADMVVAAATDHIYLDAGHVVDFANKAFELLDHLGWETAGQVLPEPGAWDVPRPPQPGTQPMATTHRLGFDGVEGQSGASRTVGTRKRPVWGMERR